MSSYPPASWSLGNALIIASLNCSAVDSSGTATSFCPSPASSNSSFAAIPSGAVFWCLSARQTNLADQARSRQRLFPPFLLGFEGLGYGEKLRVCSATLSLRLRTVCIALPKLVPAAQSMHELTNIFRL